MESVLFSIIAFIVALGVLITVHEFGHYWVARKAGVKVIRFSIGFGRPLLKWVRGDDQTEYVVAAIPLGGYVKMLDEREGDVDSSEQHRAFNNQSLAARSAIVFAGPLFNFIFAFLAYWLIFGMGVTGTKPVVGSLLDDGLALQSGIEVGDTISEINGEPVQTWEQVMSTLLMTSVDGGDIHIKVKSGEFSSSRDVIIPLPFMQDVQPAELQKLIGMRPHLPVIEAVVGTVVDNSAAFDAGLKPGDQVIHMNQQPVNDWQSMVEMVRANPATSISVQLLRDGNEILLSVVPAEKILNDGRRIGFLGVAPAPLAEEKLAAYLTKEQYGVFAAAQQGIEKIWLMTTVSLKMLWRMVWGEASLQNLSGPITIADYAGKTASIGVQEFINFLALISISLGIINLLPIPLLDGGHLLYYFIEFVKGSPVSEQTEMIGQRIGIAFLITLMSIAFYNDIARLLN
ncbi:MAG: RIP metalloprotease RseP [Gammaproteobacteria bacterium]|nr:RIP metalloprotease RseP [Gammaproteobacteria bacterium]